MERTIKMDKINTLQSKINELYSIVSGIRMTLAAVTSYEPEVIANLFKVISEDILELKELATSLTVEECENTEDVQESQVVEEPKKSTQDIDIKNALKPNITLDAIDAIALRYAEQSKDSSTEEDG